MAGKKHDKWKNVDLRKVPKAKRPKPTSGQSAPERPLPWETLNDDERAVVKMLAGRNGTRHVRTVEFLSEGIDGDNPRLQARNALRRTVACGWVERVDRGQYRISEKGRKRLARL